MLGILPLLTLAFIFLIAEAIVHKTQIWMDEQLNT